MRNAEHGDNNGVIAVLDRIGLEPGALAGRRVVIQGAVRGICREAARGMAHLGARIAFVDNRVDEGREFEAELIASGADVLFHEADLALPARHEAFLDRAFEHLGGVDILIHNAVEFQIQSILEMEMADWDRAQATNARPAVRAAQRVLPGMLDRRDGVLVNMMGPEGMAFAAAMSASKLSLRSFMFSLAEELGSDAGVAVFGYAPGFVDTPLVLDVFPLYCERIGISFDEYRDSVQHNPGYRGLMPVGHCAGSLIHSIVHASEHHGLIADSYSPLIKSGVIELGDEEERKDVQREILKKVDNASRLKAYIDEVSQLNAQIEHRVLTRTRELEDEQQRSRELLEQLENLTDLLKWQNKDLKTAERAAQSAAEIKSQFLANTSHELRTPMNALLGMIQLLSVSHLDREQRRILEVMESSGQMLLAIINDVLDLSKIDSGKFALDPRPFAPREMIQSLVDSLRGTAEEKGLKLSLELPDDLPEHILGDENRIRQVLMNLLSNAVKFTERGEVVVYGVVPGCDMYHVDLCLGVRDTGPGISEELRGRLFQPFTQGDNTRTRKFEGTGLGLYLCRKLLDEMEGTITVKSEEGRGSDFFFDLRLPLAPADRAPPTREKFRLDPDLAARHPLRILLVEDNESNQTLANFVFGKMGYEIEMAEDGMQAIEKIRSGDYDLVFMDVHMPNMDGIEATRRVRQERDAGDPRPRIIAMTASTSSEDIKEYYAAGMDGCLSKPFTFEELALVVSGTPLRRSKGADRPAPEARSPDPSLRT